MELTDLLQDLWIYYPDIMKQAAKIKVIDTVGISREALYIGSPSLLKKDL